MTVTPGRWVLLYCVLVTTALGAVTLRQAVSEPSHSSLTVLDVQRINVREPDGTLRMVISNTATEPGIIVKGKQRPHPSRKTAGIIFYNDEGTENGGLIFGGARQDGKVSSSGHLSFDQYEQDQVISLEQSEEDGRRQAGLTIMDRPDNPIPWDLVTRANTPAGKAEIEKLGKAGAFGQPRLFIGKASDRSSDVVLKDAQGRPRLLLRVAPDGAASIDFLDGNGKTQRTLTPDAK
jgi:hypothetical protein